MSQIPAESWSAADAYEQYVGRWSRLVAAGFLRWLALPAGLAWADVGCGTGALVSTLLSLDSPRSVVGLDSSHSFVAQARAAARDPRARFQIGDALCLPWAAASQDVTVSGLVLNFVPDPDAMLREMVRITRPGGWVALYVWDYAGGMQMMRHFWDAAMAVSPHDAHVDQAERFPLCQPGPLQALFERRSLSSVAVQAIVVPTSFQNFADFWNPFLGQTGAAPTYLAAASPEVRERIRLALQSRLGTPPDRPIELTARAWAVRGLV